MIINKTADRKQWFFRFTLITLILVYGLIFIGSFVRSSGAGMGCPDWPKCFGQWIPPTDVSQLPANYQAIYAHRGYSDTTFNAVHTWTEYFNRLAGVLIGISSVTLFGIGLWARRELTTGHLIRSATVALLVGFQGWLGATVVSSVLTPWVITTHMAVAVIIILILNTILATQDRSNTPYHPLLFLAGAFNLAQFILGSQVRQWVDHGHADQGLHFLGSIYVAHHWMGWLTAVVTLAWIISGWRSHDRWPSSVLAGCLSAQMLSGIIFWATDLVVTLQPVHLTAATITLGTLMYQLTKGNNTTAPTPQ